MSQEDRLLEQQREHFNSIADRYHRGRSGVNHLHLKQLMWHQALAPFRATWENRHIDVLEPMCGFCDGYDILKQHLGQDVGYHGFDYSDSVIDAVRQERPELDVWQADATKFTTNDTFDIIIILGGIHHTPLAARKIIERTAAFLRPGGLFISLEPTHGNPLFRAARSVIYRRNSLFDEETERAFPVNDLLSIFTGAGLAPVSVLYPGLMSYVLYYNPDAFPFLNVGGERLVSTIYAVDRLFIQNFIGRTLSFATLSIWRKP